MPTRVVTTGHLSVDTSDFRAFARDLKRADPVLLRSMRKKLRSAGDIVADSARDFASFSKQIPPTIRTRVSGASVSISARGVLAELEELGNKGGKSGGATSGGRFRHPVFAKGPRSKWVWVDQPMHTYLKDAVAAKGSEAADKIFEALDDAVRVIEGV